MDSLPFDYKSFINDSLMNELQENIKSFAKVINLEFYLLR